MRPTHVGQPSEVFPWPFFGARHLPGYEIAETDLAGRRAPFGAALGRFLRALHTLDVTEVLGDDAASLPRDPLGRADMAVRVPRTRKRLASLAATGLWRRSSAIEHLFEEAVALPATEQHTLVHGDLHVRHVLVDELALPAAVIDWGDVCLADPSVDLSLYWSVLDAAGRRAFRSAYGDLSAERLLRARVLALFLNAALAAYAHDVGSPRLLAESIAGLDRTLVDEKEP